jgi:Fe-S-cluster containining protein
VRDALQETRLSEASWYADGLRFACTRCGHCCGGGPGTIRVSDEEISDLAAHCHETDESFRKRYTRRLRGGDVSLVEKKNLDCIFYDRGEGCTVYPARPRQCRTWPFWSSNVHSPETWRDAARSCPGMGSGPLYDAETIGALAASDGTANDGDPG